LQPGAGGPERLRKGRTVPGAEKRRTGRKRRKGNSRHRKNEAKEGEAQGRFDVRRARHKESQGRPGKTW